MTHPRTQIRDAAKTLLAGNTTAGVRVYDSRTAPMWNGPQGLAAIMPFILVYTRDERSEIFNEAPREYKRTVRLAIEIGACGDDADDQIDAIARQVEKLLLESETLAGTAADIRISDTQMEFDGQSQQQFGAALVTFEVDYLDEVEQLAIDDLVTLGVRWDLGEPDGQIDAEDTITPDQE